MTINDLIAELKRLREEHGNLEVWFSKDYEGNRYWEIEQLQPFEIMEKDGLSQYVIKYLEPAAERGQNHVIMMWPT